MTTYTILTDMLLENKKYDEVLEVFESVKSRGVFDAKYPRDLITTYMAASYLLGTKEVFEKNAALIHEIRSSGGFLSSRAVSYFSALALKHNEYESSFEALSVLRNLTPLARNLKVITQCRLNRSDDALVNLRTYLAEDSFRKKDDILKETIDILTKSVTDSQNQQLITECEQIVRSLTEKNNISGKTLEELLNEPIHLNKRRDFIPGGFQSQQNNRRQFGNQSGYTSFDNRNEGRPLQRNRVTPIYQRRGLKEMD
jgi:pentatricopeptide repeat protein